MAESEKDEINEIVLNRMYSGYDLTQTLGKEIINIVQSDQGNNYIYLLTNGVYAQEHFGKNQVVLIVREVNPNCVQVLAKASKLEPILEKQVKEIIDNKYPNKKYSDYWKASNNTKNINSEIYKEVIKAQKEYKDVPKDGNEKEDITYGGKKLAELFPEPDKLPNASKDKSVKGRFKAYITYKAGEYRTPAKKIFIYSGEEPESLKNESKDLELIKVERNKLCSTYLVNFFSKTDDKNNFDKLLDLINKEECWEKRNTSKKVKKEKPMKQYYIEFIDQVYSEAVYSNMIVSVLRSDNKLCKHFIEELFNEGESSNSNIETGDEFVINKEVAFKLKNGKKGRIDILITDNKNNVYVIENKIQSGINGTIEPKEKKILKKKKIQRMKKIKMLYTCLNLIYIIAL